MTTSDDTKPDGPFAHAVDQLLKRHVRELRNELKVMLDDGNARTAQLIGNALGVWRKEVDSSLNDHEGRLLQIERSALPDIESRLRALEAERPTDPPPPPSGIRQ